MTRKSWRFEKFCLRLNRKLKVTFKVDYRRNTHESRCFLIFFIEIKLEYLFQNNTHILSSIQGLFFKFFSKYNTIYILCIHISGRYIFEYPVAIVIMSIFLEIVCYMSHAAFFKDFYTTLKMTSCCQIQVSS